MATNERWVDQTSAAAFLAERYGASATDVEALGGGDWSRAFSFRLDHRDLVVRFGQHREDYELDRQATAFAGPDLPVPPVLEIGEALGGFYAISERRFGVFLEALDEPGWRRVLPALLRCLDALRQIPPPAQGPVDRSAAPGSAAQSWREWLLDSLEDRPGERVSGWRAKLSEAPEDEAVFISGLEALGILRSACPEVRHVIHGDLLNRNVLVSPDGTRIEAVFDWGCSIAGDFVYEAAWLAFWSPWHPALEALDFLTVIEEHYRVTGLHVESFRQRLACCELHIGLGHIAYATFNGRSEERRAIVRRTRQVLETI
ncbi:MAG: phosphotransferase family protein [Actinomycetota bacterium]